jgi:hypothetical protein
MAVDESIISITRRTPRLYIEDETLFSNSIKLRDAVSNATQYSNVSGGNKCLLMPPSFRFPYIIFMMLVENITINITK